MTPNQQERRTQTIAEVYALALRLRADRDALLEACKAFQVAVESFPAQVQGIAAHVTWGDAIEKAKAAIAQVERP